MPDRTRALRLGVAGPVGTGKSSLIALICRELGAELSLAVVTNDIYTDEDARFLRSAGVLAPERIRAVETGACPHTAIRDDVTQNLIAVEDLERDFAPVDVVLVESGGDNLTATFSPALVDAQFFVLDVAGGGDVARKGGPGIARADVLIVNKTDLAPHVGVDVEQMVRDATQARDGRTVIALSRTDRASIEALTRWVRQILGRLPRRGSSAPGSRADGPARACRRHRPYSLSDHPDRRRGGRGPAAAAPAAGSAAGSGHGNTAEACRIGLVATTALLLGGDTVELVVEVGPGAALDLFDVAGTVAYHGRGQPATWHTSVVVAEGGRLRYRGEPFVVAEGADVARTLVATLVGSARCVLRETVVLGREGETGGRLRCRTEARRDGRPIWLEEQDLAPDGIRGLPGILGSNRVMDSLISLGPHPEAPISGTVSYQLAGGAGTVQRLLTGELAGSPLHAWARRC